MWWEEEELSRVAPTLVLVTTDEATRARTTAKPGQGEELVRPLSHMISATADDGG